MFRFWLHFHPLLMLLALLFVFGVSGCIVHWVQCRSRLRPRIQKCALAAPTFVGVSTLFALFAAFLLAGEIAQKTRAIEAVESEGAALVSLAVDSELAAKGGDAIRGAIRNYAQSVVGGEWLYLAREGASPDTARSALALMRVVRDLPPQDNVNSSVYAQMLALVQKVMDARAARIAIVTNHVQQFAWTGLFLLGFLTQFGIGMAHLERAPNVMGLAFFSLGAVIGLWLIAMQDNPFRGHQPVSPAPIAKVIAMLPVQ